MTGSYPFFASQQASSVQFSSMSMPIDVDANPNNTLTEVFNAYQAALASVEPNTKLYLDQQTLLRSYNQAIEDLNKYNNNPKKRTKLLNKLYNDLNDSALLLSALNELYRTLRNPNTFTSPAYQQIPEHLKSNFKCSVVSCYREARLLTETLVSKTINTSSVEQIGLLTTTLESITNLYKDPSNIGKLTQFSGIISALPAKVPAWHRLAGAAMLALSTAFLIATSPFLVLAAMSGAAMAVAPVIVFVLIPMVVGLNLMLKKNHPFYKGGLGNEMISLRQSAQSFQAQVPTYSLYSPLPPRMSGFAHPAPTFYQPLPPQSLMPGINQQQPQHPAVSQDYQRYSRS
jgi:hypothetical protein